MPRNRGNHTFGNAGLRENFQHLAFAKKRIAKCQLDRLRMPFREKCACHSGRPAPRKRQFFANGKMRRLRSGSIFRRALNVRRCGRQQA